MASSIIRVTYTDAVQTFNRHDEWEAVGREAQYINKTKTKQK